MTDLRWPINDGRKPISEIRNPFLFQFQSLYPKPVPVTVAVAVAAYSHFAGGGLLLLALISSCWIA